MNASTTSTSWFPKVGPRAAVIVPALVALVLRVVYVLTFRESPAFDQPIMDEAIHDGWARGGMEILYDGVAYFRAPLYMWFLQLNYLIDDGYLWVRLVQAFLSALTVGLVADLGRRLAGPLAGLVGGLILAFCWPVIYFAGELVIVTFFMTLVVTGLWLLVVADARRTLGLALAGAAVLGIASMARPTVLVFLPALAWLGLRTWKDWLDSPRARLLGTLGMLFLMLVPGLALTVRNQVVGGDAVFIASQGGVNFYIGNNSQSDGRTAVVPGTSATWAGGYLEAIRLAQEAEGRSLKPSEVSDHYFRRGLRFWAEDPGGAFRLYGKKLRLLVGAAEQSNNKNPHFWRAQNPLLSLPVFSSWALVFALGIVGVFLARRRREAVPLNLFLLLYAVGLLLFFLNERFRTPETIVLASFAGVPVAAAWEAWGKAKARVVTISVAVLAVLTLSSLDRIGFHGDEVEADAFSQYSLGNMYLRADDPEQAARVYLGALDAARTYRLAGFDEVERMLRDNLVMALLRAGEEVDAERQVEHFAGAWPEDWRSELLRGRIALYRYDLPTARRHFEKALERNPDSAEAMVGLGRALMRRQAIDLAERQLRQALAVGGDRADAWGALAMLSLGQADNAGRAWRYAERALELDPGDALGNHVLAEFYRRQNDVTSMLYYYRRSLLREPHSIPITRVLRRMKIDREQLLADDAIPAPPPRN
jgi:tetratricopeptide (TPR) repeat protein